MSLIYADYSFYTKSYLLGNDPVIPKNAFSYYANKASAKIRNVIRLDMLDITDDSEVTDEMRMATCEVAEILCTYDKKTVSDLAGTNTDEVIPVGIASEKVGEYSVSYSDNSEADRDKREDQKISDSFKKWLGPAGLLFRGII